MHDLKIVGFEARGQSLAMHVENAAGATAEITMGQPGKSRDKRLRILLGHADLDGAAEIRAALEGKRVRLKISTYGFGQPGRQVEYRGIERA